MSERRFVASALGEPSERAKSRTAIHAHHSTKCSAEPGNPRLQIGAATGHHRGHTACLRQPRRKRCATPCRLRVVLGAVGWLRTFMITYPRYSDPV